MKWKALFGEISDKWDRNGFCKALEYKINFGYNFLDNKELQKRYSWLWV